MSNHIFIDGIRFVSTADAAHQTGFGRDYIYRLCREGRLVRRMIGKQWYVEERSIAIFLEAQKSVLRERAEELSRSMSHEYRERNPFTTTQAGKVLDGRQYVLIAEAAAESGLTRNYIYRLSGEGKILSKQVGGNRYVERASLHTFLVQNEYSKSLRQDSLSREYQNTYPRKHASASGDDGLRSSEFLRRAAAALEHTHSVKTPPLTPLTEFVHKLVALTLACMLTLGTYAAVDPQAARFAADSVRESMDTVLDAYHTATNGGLTQLAQRTQSQVAAVAEHPGATLASAASSVGDFIPSASWRIATTLARTINERVNSLIYAAAFPTWLTDLSSGGTVAIDIQPYAQPTPTQTTAPVRTTASGGVPPKAVIIQNPIYPERVERITERVIERTLQTERVVTMGGITEDVLNDRLDQLKNSLTAQIYGITAASSPVASGGVINMIAATNRIDQLSGVAISGGTISGAAISGGSISGTSVSGSSVSATTLSSSGDTSLATTTVTGNLTVTGAASFGSFSLTAVDLTNATSTTLFATSTTFVNATSTNFFATNFSATNFNPTNISTTNATNTNATSTNLYSTNASLDTASTTNLTWVNATGTNSTSTNLYSSSLTAGNATSTNLFATLGRLTTGIIDTLTATLATITTLTSTNLTATNATTTSATSTNLTVFTALVAPSFTATSTTASTLPYASSTALTATTLFSTNFLALASSTLQDFTFTNATGTAATTTSFFTTTLQSTNATTTTLFSTTASSTNLFTSSFSIGGLTGILKATGGVVSTATAGTDYVTGAGLAAFYPFQLTGNATSTLTQFNGGLTAYASTTIGDGTQAGGLTISGGATTTGNSILQGTLAVTGGTTLSSALTYGGVTLSNAVTGTGNMVLSASPTFTTGLTVPSVSLSNGGGGATGYVRSHTSDGIEVGSTSASPLWFITNSIERMRIDSSGSVGIGTTTPWGKFSINNSTSDTAGQPLFVVASSTASATTTVFFIANSGNVGIGTTSPQRIFHVYGTDIRPRFESTSASGYIALDYKNDNRVWQTGVGGSSVTDGVANKFFLWDNANSAYRMVVDTSGNVGIGTTTPWGKFSINNSTNDTAGQPLFVVASSTASATTTSFIVTNSGNVGIGTTTPATSLVIVPSATGGGIRIDGSTGSTISPALRLDLDSTQYLTLVTASAADQAITGAIAGEAVIKNVQASALLFGTTNLERMRITAGGNVGIGTTLPASSLDVATSSTATTLTGESTARGIAIVNTDTTTNNFAALQFRTMDSSANLTTGAQIASVFTNHSESLVDGDLVFLTNGTGSLTEKMRILAEGNVGIGTTSPLAKLSVKGDGSSTGFNFQTTDSTNKPVFSILDSGQTTVGSTTATFTIGGVTNTGFQVLADGGPARIALARYDDNANGTGIFFGKSRGALGVSSAAVQSGDDITQFRFHGDDGATAGGLTLSDEAARITASVDGTVSTNIVPGRLTFSTTNTSGALTERLRIDSSGYVGIGTTTPTNTLAVQGTLSVGNGVSIDNSYPALARLSKASTGGQYIGITANGSYPWSIGTVYGAGNKFAIGTSQATDSNFTAPEFVIYDGDVGVGTASPGYKLDIVDASTANETIANIKSSASSGYGLLGIQNGSNQVFYGVNPNGGSYIKINPTVSSSNTAFSISHNLGGTNLLTILGNGNVGIGTASPSSSLHVLNNATSSVMYVQNTSQGNAGIRFNAWNDPSKDFLVHNNNGEFFINGTGGSSGAIVFSNAASTERMRITSAGAVGIGTSTPGAKLVVAGGSNGTIVLDTTTGTSAYYRFSINGAVQSHLSDDGSKIIVYSNAAASTGQYITHGASTWSSLSDSRLKSNVQAISEESGLDAINRLNPVTYNWIDANAEQKTQLGFIAQDLAQVFPDLVSDAGTTTITLADGSKQVITDTKGINYTGIIPPLVKAVQELNLKAESLASSTPNGANQSFVDGFFSNLFARVTEWLASATNGIGDVLARTFRASDKLCINDTCVTEAQLQMLLANAASSGDSSGGGSSDSGDTPPQDSGSATTPPTIEIHGLNPTTISTGSTYADLGASITGPTTADTNLGLHLFVDGVEMTSVQIDTTEAGTHIVEYTATNDIGTATSTRTVIVESPAAPDTATSTPDTTASSTPENTTGDTPVDSGTTTGDTPVDSGTTTDAGTTTSATSTTP